jgi:hypothetical protein
VVERGGVNGSNGGDAWGGAGGSGGGEDFFMERLRELRTSEWKSRRWNWAKISESRDYLTLVILKVSVEANSSQKSLYCLKRPTILSNETHVLRPTVFKSHYTV